MLGAINREEIHTVVRDRTHRTPTQAQHIEHSLYTEKKKIKIARSILQKIRQSEGCRRHRQSFPRKNLTSHTPCRAFHTRKPLHLKHSPRRQARSTTSLYLALAYICGPHRSSVYTWNALAPSKTQTPCFCLNLNCVFTCLHPDLKSGVTIVKEKILNGNTIARYFSLGIPVLLREFSKKCDKILHKTKMKAFFLSGSCAPPQRTF